MGPDCPFRDLAAGLVFRPLMRARGNGASPDSVAWVLAALVFNTTTAPNLDIISIVAQVSIPQAWLVVASLLHAKVLFSYWHVFRPELLQSTPPGAKLWEVGWDNKAFAGAAKTILPTMFRPHPLSPTGTMDIDNIEELARARFFRACYNISILQDHRVSTHARDFAETYVSWRCAVRRRIAAAMNNTWCDHIEPPDILDAKMPLTFKSSNKRITVVLDYNNRVLTVARPDVPDINVADLRVQHDDDCKSLVLLRGRTRNQTTVILAIDTGLTITRDRPDETEACREDKSEDVVIATVTIIPPDDPSSSQDVDKTVVSPKAHALFSPRPPRAVVHSWAPPPFHRVSWFSGRRLSRETPCFAARFFQRYRQHVPK